MDLMNKKLCLIVGAGAIGKAVAGYVFSRIGCRTVFTDIDRSVVDDIDRNKGYELLCTEYDRPNKTQTVSNVSAVSLQDKQAEELAIEADYICTAIGSIGMQKFLPTLTGWIKKRKFSKPLYIILMENDFELKRVITDYLLLNLNEMPKELHILQTSIERMTKNIVPENGNRTIITEQFIRVILEKSGLTGSGLEKQTDYFEMVDEVKPYYYRKLYTNNLGHAVLGYIGQYKGYTNTVEAIEDEYISKILDQVLEESGQMLIKKFGFSRQEIDEHKAALIKRYSNSGMLDELSRLIRDPLRKLSNKERIVGALLECDAYGISASGIITTLFYVLEYCTNKKTLEPQVSELIDKFGVGGVLEQICQIEKGSSVFLNILDQYEIFQKTI